MTPTTTPWQTVDMPRFPALTEDSTCDVLVVGGGLTGLTAAYLLTRAGLRVVLLESGRLASGDTACTTAHLTMVTDTRLSELVDVFGRDAAQLVWQGGAAAIEMIEQHVRQELIDCAFQRVPGYLHAPWKNDGYQEDGRSEAEQLRRDAQLAEELGFAAQFLDAVPGVGQPGVQFPNQALFNPLAYLAGLARAVNRAGGAIFEDSEAARFEGDPPRVHVNGHVVRCGYVIVATHVPLMGKSGFLPATLLQSKLAKYTTYAIAADLPNPSRSAASYWDTADPYRYLRIHHEQGRACAILGGEDHKTGQADDMTARFQRLAHVLAEMLPEATVQHRWSGQVIETNDGLPYIGQTASGQFVATGFAGNGMTLGTLAGHMAAQWAQGKPTPWDDLFAVQRRKIRGGMWEYLKENFDYPYYLLMDRLKRSQGDSPLDVPRGEAKVLMLGGQRVACFRDQQGNLSSVSAICPHMGCIVHWNSAEQTWDCPCHGSRFKPDGELLAGPAESPLAPVEPLAAEAQEHARS